MMKLRILLLNLLVVYTIHFMAQESYSNDVTCMKADDNIAVITASGTAEKKKDVYNMALKSIFNAIFLNGIDGVENGQPLVGKEDSYYMNQFFSSRYMLFVKFFVFCLPCSSHLHHSFKFSFTLIFCILISSLDLISEYLTSNII